MHSAARVCAQCGGDALRLTRSVCLFFFCSSFFSLSSRAFLSWAFEFGQIRRPPFLRFLFFSCSS